MNTNVPTIYLNKFVLACFMYMLFIYLWSFQLVRWLPSNIVVLVD